MKTEITISLNEEIHSEFFFSEDENQTLDNEEAITLYCGLLKTKMINQLKDGKKIKVKQTN